MATVTATKYNPDIKAQYERLQQNGKCKIQALPKSGWFSLILNLLKFDLTLVCRSETQHLIQSLILLDFVSLIQPTSL